MYSCVEKKLLPLSGILNWIKGRLQGALGEVNGQIWKMSGLKGTCLNSPDLN